MQSAGEKCADIYQAMFQKIKSFQLEDIIKNLPKAPEWLVKKYN